MAVETGLVCVIVPDLGPMLDKGMLQTRCKPIVQPISFMIYGTCGILLFVEAVGALRDEVLRLDG